jgi:hypothetical protein
MSPIVAAGQSVPSDAIERFDDEANEVIMMDPKNYYMIYLLRASAFLHSSVAFLMMISYYKLKVENLHLKILKVFLLCLGPIGYIQKRKRNSSKIRI